MESVFSMVARGERLTRVISRALFLLGDEYIYANMRLEVLGKM